MLAVHIGIGDEHLSCIRQCKSCTQVQHFGKRMRLNYQSQPQNGSIEKLTVYITVTMQLIKLLSTALRVDLDVLHRLILYYRTSLNFPF